MAATWGWLNEHVTKETRTEVLPAEGKKKPKTRKIKEEFVEMGVLALRTALGRRRTGTALTMPREAGSRVHAGACGSLSQTSPEPAVSPDPSVFLHGPETGPPDVQVVWRADLGEDPERWSEMAAICPAKRGRIAGGSNRGGPALAGAGGGGGEAADIEGRVRRERKGEREMRPVSAVARRGGERGCRERHGRG